MHATCFGFVTLFIHLEPANKEKQATDRVWCFFLFFFSFFFICGPFFACELLLVVEKKRRKPISGRSEIKVCAQSSERQVRAHNDDDDDESITRAHQAKAIIIYHEQQQRAQRFVCVVCVCELAELFVVCNESSVRLSVCLSVFVCVCSL